MEAEALGVIGGKRALHEKKHLGLPSAHAVTIQVRFIASRL
jgi:hypothetical protein